MRASHLQLASLPVFSVFCFIVAGPCFGQADTAGESFATVTITGRILDEETGRPVEGATIRLLPDGPDGLSNTRGDFRIPDIRPGSHELEIHHVGYGTALVPSTIQPGESLHLRLKLHAKAVKLAPLEVTVEREHRSNYLTHRGFYERAEGDFGHFWTPEDLDRRNPLRTSHVLQQTPGVRIVRKCGTETTMWPRCIQLPRMARSASLGGNCPPTVYLDGHKMTIGGGTRMGIDDIVPISSLAAIEIYRGAGDTAPEFIDSDSRCGVVVLWTKHGPI